MKLRLPRPLWFAIPTAFLVVAVVGIQVGVPIYRQRRAIATIERCGGGFILTRRGPPWLRSLFGDDWMESFDDVILVNLETEAANDSDLSCIASLTSVKEVRLINTQITDAGLVHLKRKTSLENVSLSESKVTNSGLRHLQGLNHLRVLDLFGTAVTDQGLKELQEMRSLRFLNLENTKVTDAGVAELQQALPDLGIER